MSPVEEAFRIAIITTLSADAVLLAVAYCLHRRTWTANDMNVWWLLLGWSAFGWYASVDNIINDRPSPGWRTITLLGLAVLTFAVALGILKRPSRLGPRHRDNQED